MISTGDVPFFLISHTDRAQVEQGEQEILNSLKVVFLFQHPFLR